MPFRFIVLVCVNIMRWSHTLVMHTAPADQSLACHLSCQAGWLSSQLAPGCLSVKATIVHGAGAAEERTIIGTSQLMNQFLTLIPVF